jgi:hypothetical protein
LYAIVCSIGYVPFTRAKSGGRGRLPKLGEN